MKDVSKVAKQVKPTTQTDSSHFEMVNFSSSIVSVFRCSKGSKLSIHYYILLYFHRP